MAPSTPANDPLTVNAITAARADVPPMCISIHVSHRGRRLKEPSVQEGYARIGQDPAFDTPEEFSALIREETAKWSRVIKGADIQPQ